MYDWVRVYPSESEAGNRGTAARDVVEMQPQIHHQVPRRFVSWRLAPSSFPGS